MKIGDLVRAKHEPASVGLVIAIPEWLQDASLDDDEWDEYSIAHIMWVRDEIEPLYEGLEQIKDLEVIDVQSR